MSWVRVPTEQLFFSFSMEKELFKLVVLPCFDLCRSKIFHVCTVLMYWYFCRPYTLTIHGFRFILIKLIIILLQFITCIIHIMQLFCSHNDFSLNKFLSHCRHPLQVETSASCSASSLSSF